MTARDSDPARAGDDEPDDRLHDGGRDGADGSATGDWFDSVVAAIAAAERTVAFTGAGVSTASGIPDYRSADGVWQEYEPANFRYERFQSDPAGFWHDRVGMHEAVYGDSVAPNAAHEALAALESDGLDAVVTQNVDGLHAAAGSESVVELHGCADRVVCPGCGARFPAAPVRDRVQGGECPPRCVDCEAVLKPDVVLFGEALPAEQLGRARQLAREADVFLVAGSSLSVQPAASLPRTAARDGTLIVLNLEATPVSEGAAYDVRTDVEAALPQLAATVRRRPG